MRRAGRLAAECLDMLIPHVVPGVTTQKIDDMAREFVLSNGALPACLFYKGYRHTVCTSVNHVVCHGIPGPKTLKEGDIVNIDVTVIVDGWHGDTSRMYSVGEASRRSSRARGSAISALRSRSMRSASAIPWSRRSAGTGSGACFTTRRTFSISASAGRASHCCRA